ncbi:MAG: DinB family protein [Flavobacterium sp.]
MNFHTVKGTLEDLRDLLYQLSDEQYTLPVNYLGNSSVGGHVRHIIELFQCLQDSYDTGLLNYDNRKRDKQIETDPLFAVEVINLIVKSIEKDNRNLSLEQIISGDCILIETNYFREVVYNLEHCIHHQALIKVATYQLENIHVKENFGVAPSTIEYRKQCAQ